MLEKVQAFCERHHLLPNGCRILVACSGGPDSLALLHWLWQMRGKYQLQIGAAHFEHGIRGAESKQDAAFVRTFCAERGIPFALASADVPSIAAKRKISLEKAARDCRYAFLRRTMQEQKYQRLALAHHADDQAETVFMRILRGTGTAGLAAMRPLSTDGERIRPFLCLTKAEIQAYCQAQHLKPRHDATNDVADALRNRLRLSLLPELKRAFNPELSRALCQLSEIAADENDFLQQEANRYWHDEKFVRFANGWQLSQEGIASLHPALQRVLLRRFWQKVTREGTDLGYVQAELLRRLLLQGKTGSQQELPHHYTAKIAYGWLTCQKTGKDVAFCPELPLQLGKQNFGAYGIEVKEVSREAVTFPAPLNVLYLPKEQTSRLVWRTRAPGDWMDLPAGRKKIKKLLIDAKVPQALRDGLPLLADGQEILWLPEVRRSLRVSLDKYKDYPIYLQIKISHIQK